MLKGYRSYLHEIRRFLSDRRTKQLWLWSAVLVCLLAYQNFDPTNVLNNDVPSKSERGKPFEMPDFSALRDDKHFPLYDTLIPMELQPGATEKEIADALLKNGTKFIGATFQENHGAWIENSQRQLASIEDSMSFHLGGSESSEIEQPVGTGGANAGRAKPDVKKDSPGGARIQWMDRGGSSSFTVGTSVALLCRYNYASRESLVNVSTPVTERGSVSLDVHPHDKSSRINFNLSW